MSKSKPNKLENVLNKFSMGAMTAGSFIEKIPGLEGIGTAIAASGSIAMLADTSIQAAHHQLTKSQMALDFSMDMINIAGTGASSFLQRKLIPNRQAEAVRGIQETKSNLEEAGKKTFNFDIEVFNKGVLNKSFDENELVSRTAAAAAEYKNKIMEYRKNYRSFLRKNLDELQDKQKPPEAPSSQHIPNVKMTKKEHVQITMTLPELQKWKSWFDNEKIMETESYLLDSQGKLMEGTKGTSLSFAGLSKEELKTIFQVGGKSKTIFQGVDPTNVIQHIQTFVNNDLKGYEKAYEEANEELKNWTRIQRKFQIVPHVVLGVTLAAHAGIWEINNQYGNQN